MHRIFALERPTVNEEQKASVVDILQNALNDALAGKVTDVVIVSKEIDGDWYHRASSTLSLREKVGAVEIIKANLILQHLDG